MEFKGTKGKWEENGQFIMGGGNYSYLFKVDPFEILEEEEGKAYIKLASKAPEMLEMLEKVTDELTHCLNLLYSDGNKHEVDFQTAHEAYELIKEATEKDIK